MNLREEAAKNRAIRHLVIFCSVVSSPESRGIPFAIKGFDRLLRRVRGPIPHLFDICAFSGK